MATVLQKHIGQSKAIVYLDFIGDVNSLAIALREKGTLTAAYHGDKMSPHDKAKVINNWKAGGVQVVVCTKAFGLGINQPGVGDHKNSSVVILGYRVLKTMLRAIRSPPPRNILRSKSPSNHACLMMILQPSTVCGNWLPMPYVSWSSSRSERPTP